MHFRLTSGVTVIRSGFDAVGLSRREAAPLCPTCQQAVSIGRRPLTGQAVESCGCPGGWRLVPRVLSTHFVTPPTVNPFTVDDQASAKAVIKIVRPRDHACADCGGPCCAPDKGCVPRCKECAIRRGVERRRKHLGAVVEREIATAYRDGLGFKELRRRYKVGHTVITRILTQHGVLRRPGRPPSQTPCAASH